ncbi:hypothetical protein IFM89_025097 [Coptis chinensis]|uniref:RNase H type-1 domain-containing protein n=1 Tax=Coptis chinensis TaxID=261450 RepID=A0A835HXX7_9MAGN|nr:hypothetical protein IFM89_025097 [Coptis chinensis]
MVVVMVVVVNIGLVVKDATDSIGTREFMHRIGLQVNYVPSTFIECLWIKPGEDEVMLNPDGSVTASSCGYGGVRVNREDTVLGAYIGSSLNRSVTFRELLAVEKGLECALLMNLKKVSVATDSYRVMQIIQGKETIPWVGLGNVDLPLSLLIISLFQNKDFPCGAVMVAVERTIAGFHYSYDRAGLAAYYLGWLLPRK